MDFELTKNDIILLANNPIKNINYLSLVKMDDMEDYVQTVWFLESFVLAADERCNIQVSRQY